MLGHAVSRLSILWVVGFLACSQGASAADPPRAKKTRRVNPAMQRIADDPDLPRLLLIGDSISIGYTLPVRQLLQGTANVHRPSANCGPTTRGLEAIDSWLGDKPWDVIHFNWGLHDLKYMGPNGKNLAEPDATGAHQQVPADEYEANLRKLVKRLKRTGATLIWCTTTPVPEGAAGRVVGDSARYNKIAAEIMEEEGVAIDDLYAFAKPRLKEIQKPANVHFTPEGSQALAEQVVQTIKTALEAKRGAD